MQGKERGDGIEESVHYAGQPWLWQSGAVWGAALPPQLLAAAGGLNRIKWQAGYSPCFAHPYFHGDPKDLKAFDLYSYCSAPSRRW